MQNQFQAVSLSYRNAPLAIREQLALSEEEAKAFMLQAKEFFEVSDLMVVSTCNRTEVYANIPERMGEEIAKLLLIFKQVSAVGEYLNYFEFFEEGAARHLFEVATGLHSQVVGDMQIPNQIKQAYQWSADLHLAGPFLHRLMHTIFYANKRVAMETSFRDGAASVSYAAADLAASLLADPAILVVGLGEIGADVCRNLVSAGVGTVTVINRTRERSEAMVAEVGCRMAELDDLQEELRKADIIISSVARDEPFFTKELVAGLGILSFKYFIDLSVPRSVSPAVEEIPGVVLYDVDALRSKADQALELRMAAIPQVREIIENSLQNFSNWSEEIVVSPTINRLKSVLEQIRQEELSRYMKGLNESEMAIVEKITSSMMQKIIKLPVLQLKAACKRGEAETLIDVLNDLFNLEAQPEVRQ